MTLSKDDEDDVDDSSKTLFSEKIYVYIIFIERFTVRSEMSHEITISYID